MKKKLQEDVHCHMKATFKGCLLKVMAEIHGVSNRDKGSESMNVRIHEGKMSSSGCSLLGLEQDGHQEEGKARRSDVGKAGAVWGRHNPERKRRRQTRELQGRISRVSRGLGLEAVTLCRVTLQRWMSLVICRNLTVCSQSYCP